MWGAYVPGVSRNVPLGLHACPLFSCKPPGFPSLRGKKLVDCRQELARLGGNRACGFLDGRFVCAEKSKHPGQEQLFRHSRISARLSSCGMEWPRTTRSKLWSSRLQYWRACAKPSAEVSVSYLGEEQFAGLQKSRVAGDGRDVRHRELRCSVLGAGVRRLPDGLPAPAQRRRAPIYRRISRCAACGRQIPVRRGLRAGGEDR